MSTLTVCATVCKMSGYPLFMRYSCLNKWSQIPLRKEWRNCCCVNLAWCGETSLLKIQPPLHHYVMGLGNSFEKWTKDHEFLLGQHSLTFWSLMLDFSCCYKLRNSIISVALRILCSVNYLCNSAAQASMGTTLTCLVITVIATLWLLEEKTLSVATYSMVLRSCYHFFYQQTKLCNSLCLVNLRRRAIHTFWWCCCPCPHCKSVSSGHSYGTRLSGVSSNLPFPEPFIPFIYSNAMIILAFQLCSEWAITFSYVSRGHPSSEFILSLCVFARVCLNRELQSQ